ncbi:hypothetical protein D9758_012526 [Tetrapyrgos nigripes]|uniref:Uncharacterized protein n=1 Tax=Tetrapyrgos nigripes TaxID=182062 RepID=A0A8H5G333_9AGAR|nr:hypothetical protein D9758_012526 [Tetrapyrgos nigripes]
MTNIENKLVQVATCRLENVADGLKDLLSILSLSRSQTGSGDTADPMSQAGTFNNPIDMGPTVSKEESYAFLNYIKLLEWKPTPEAENKRVFLFALLKIAHKWGCASAMRYAAKEIDSLDGIRPFDKLQLSLSYGVPQWIDRYIPYFIQTPIYKYSDNDKTLLKNSPFLYSLIAEAQIAISNERRQIAIGVPPLHEGAPSCRYYGINHKSSLCNRAWNEGWWNFSKELLRPYPFETRLEDAWSILQEFEFRGVTKACRDEALDVVEESKEFDGEKELIREVCSKVRAELPMGPLTIS